MGGSVTLCGSLDLGNAAIPVEDLLAVPVQHAFVLIHVVVDLLEIFDPVRLPADIGVDRQRADFRALGTLGIKPVELVDGAPEQVVALVMLDQHHRNVIELDAVGQGDERPIGGADHRRLIVVNPVADIFHARGGKQFGRVERLRETRTEPADRLLAGELGYDVHAPFDHAGLSSPCGSDPVRRRGP